MKQLLPGLYDFRNIKTKLDMHDRYRAIKSVAERSLALSDSGSDWTAALESCCFRYLEKVEDSTGTWDLLMETSSNPETSLAQFFSKDSDHLMRARCFLSILTAISEKFPACLHSVFDKRNRHRFGRETFSLSSRLKGHQTISKLRNCYRSINSNENAAIQYKKIIVKRRRRLSITSYLRKRTTLGKRKRVMLFSKLKRRNPFVSQNLSVNCQSESWKQEQLPRDRIATLQSIIPGGRRMSNDNLLRETANYIKLLRCQFDLLTSLVAIAEDRAL